MYVPEAFEASDIAFCHEVMRAFPFALLVTTSATGGCVATPVPFLLDETRGENGTLIGHLARANPQHETLARGAEALVAFSGPDAYVSPSWYAEGPAVPTWNYVAVHAYGTATLLGESETLAYLARLSERFEGSVGSSWDPMKFADDYRSKMIRGIVAFAVELRRVDGKAKLSQNRSPEDAENVARRLEGSPREGDRKTAAEMRRSRTKR